jgi:hypothetical protein
MALTAGGKVKEGPRPISIRLDHWKLLDSEQFIETTVDNGHSLFGPHPAANLWAFTESQLRAHEERIWKAARQRDDCPGEHYYDGMTYLTINDYWKQRAAEGKEGE